MFAPSILEWKQKHTKIHFQSASSMQRAEQQNTQLWQKPWGRLTSWYTYIHAYIGLRALGARSIEPLRQTNGQKHFKRIPCGKTASMVTYNLALPRASVVEHYVSACCPISGNISIWVGLMFPELDSIRLLLALLLKIVPLQYR